MSPKVVVFPALDARRPVRDPGAMPARVSSAAFVGRGPQLAELEVALATARGGRASLAFVAGESGVGKTRLLDEFVLRARAAGTRVLWGDCVELGEREVPYAPLVAALRDLVRRGDPVLDELGRARAELARLVPELGEATDLRVEPFSGSAQGRVFELLLALLELLSRRTPVVLVLEDLHWADASTRDFLRYWASNLCSERVLLVGSYRVDELHRRHPLRPLLAEVERSERARRVALERFTREELAEQLRDILDTDPDPDLLDRLYARSEGNALYAEELLAAEREGDGTLPDSLRDALMLRVEALSDPAQEALRWVAAAHRIEHDVLAEVSGIGTRELRDALRQAVAHHVLVSDDDGAYAFRHALLREAVHDDLLPGERAELHLALARALEARAAGVACVSLQRAAAIAHHYDAAGDQPAALRSAVRAAQKALSAMAFGEAVALYDRALKLWDRVEDAPALAGTDHVGLLHQAAVAHDADPGRAVDLVRAALEELGRDADPARASLLSERLGKALWGLGKGEAAIEAWDAALNALPVDPPTEERARLLGAKAAALMLWGRFEDGDRMAVEALEAGRVLGSPYVQMHALNTLGVTRLATGTVQEAGQMLERAMAMAREEDEVFQLSRGYINLSDILHLSGRTRAAYDLLEEGLRELQIFGHKGTWIIFQRAEMAYHLGLWDESDALLAPEIEPRHRGMTRVFYETRRAELDLARGHFTEARRRVEHAHDLVARSFEAQWHIPIAALLAELERRARRPEAARAAIAEGLQRVASADITADAARTRILASAAGIEADAAQHARDLGRRHEERAAVDASARFAAEAARAAASPPARNIPEAAANAMVAEAEAAAATGHPDPALFARAADAWAAIERPYGTAHSRWREAETRLATGDRAGAQAAVGEAHALACRLGASWLADEVAALARRGRLRLAAGELAPAPVAGPPAEDPAAALGLTPREREVLELVAQGATNREIGEQLFMAEKTASVHVSRILTKLDVRSRTQAAAVAHRLGLEGASGAELAAAG